MISNQKKILHYYNPEVGLPLIPVYAVYDINGNWLVKTDNEENGIFLNKWLFETAITEIDKPDNPFFGKINQTPPWSEKYEKGIFLLVHDGANDNTFLHSVPHYIMVNHQCRLFFDYTHACSYGKYLSKDFSVYKFHLAH